ALRVPARPVRGRGARGDRPLQTRNGPGANPPRRTPGPPRREIHHGANHQPPARLPLLRRLRGDAARYALPSVRWHRAVRIVPPVRPCAYEDSKRSGGRAPDHDRKEPAMTTTTVLA